MPLYRAGTIVWLAMESLCRQQDPPPWELLVAEDVNEDDPIGREAIEAYLDRLPNCVAIKYLSMPTWIPLSVKWQVLAQMADCESAYIALQAADCYSYSRRLNYLIGMKSDWVQSVNYTFYDLQSGKGGKLDIYEQGTRTGDMMAIRMYSLRSASVPIVRRGVDTALFSGVRPQTIYQWSMPGWKLGASVSGQNSLSVGPFARTMDDSGFRLEDHLPQDICVRLFELGRSNPLPPDRKRDPLCFIDPNGDFVQAIGILGDRIKVVDVLGNVSVWDDDELAYQRCCSRKMAERIYHQVLEAQP